MASTPRDPLLRLNDPELEWKRYERFCLDLARALPEVADTHLYGTRGEAQQGIDIHADLYDGQVRTIQCRRVEKFGKRDAESTIADTTYEADEHVVWVSCPLTTGARKVIDAADSWDAWDVEQLSSQLRALPREQARWLVEDHLGGGERRRLLGPESELCLVPASTWYASRDRREGLLGTHQQLRGRDAELAELRSAVEDHAVRVVVLVGRGGIGKTRLLRALADESPSRRMLLLLEGADVTAALSDELPLASFDLIIDDAHRRDDLSSVLATVLRRDELNTVVLASRPHRLAALRADLIELDVAADAVRGLAPLADLEQAATQELAADELGGEHPELAEPLARLTRDAPAVCVLGARLLRTGELAPAELGADDTVRRDILARFRDEALGRVGDGVDPRLAAQLLTLVAALQPVDVAAEYVLAWLAEQAGATPEAVRTGVRALEAAHLLVGSGRRRRVAPDILADQLVHDACVDANGNPTGWADELVAAAPEGALGRLLVNLAELDWRLSFRGEPRVLDQVCRRLQRQLVAADAWRRERLLEMLADSAAYLGPWVVSTARELLDHPARDAPLALDMVIRDADARRRLVPLLREAGLDPACTEAAMQLLWEIGADLPAGPTSGSEEPLEALRRLGDYQLPTGYAETLLRVVEDLLADPHEAEARRAVPARLLSGLVQREGTTSRARGYQVQLGSYYVDAKATTELRGRLRALLVDRCQKGGPRTRVACAELLGDMLRQPHGYYGRGVPKEVLMQWRDEQLALLTDIDSVLTKTDDPLVARRFRDDLHWHAEHSSIRGVKTRARAMLRAHPESEDEQLARALSHSLAQFADRHALARRRRQLARALLNASAEPEALLLRIDAMLNRLASCEPDVTRDCGALLATLANVDPDWALAACPRLIGAPERPTASGVGVLLTAVLEARPDAAHSLLADLANGDVALRRLAADHVSRMAWVDDRDAPERALAVGLAADEDAWVVLGVLLAALRIANAEPDLARRIVLAISDLSQPQVAEDTCMVLTHDIGLTGEDWALLFERLLACPVVEYWYERVIASAASRYAQLVLDHLLARCDQQPDDWNYHALPHDGLSGDPLAAAPDLRAAALAEIANRLASSRAGRRSHELPVLFWSIAGDAEEAFTAIADELAAGGDRRDAAELLLGEAAAGRILARPEWVAAQLEASEGGESLDALRGALYGALRSGIRQGTPGEPFPQDVALAERARELLVGSPAGSRTARFWSELAEAVEADMREEVLRDRDLIDE